MADDLATVNLQKIDDYMASAAARGEDIDGILVDQVDRAKAAQASGDTAEAIAITGKVLERLERSRTA
ncbi:hypothetical protein ACFY2H_38890 [Streptomyces griseofuscus]|uniref:hypothetical protein n=1 Tax=Streptomyces griseofuscus TaxID=146922 RepID=UPI0036895574